MTTDEQIPKTITVQASDYNLSDFFNVIFSHGPKKYWSDSFSVVVNSCS